MLTKLRRSTLRLVWLAGISLCSFHCGLAQSTVFNVPSTDIQPAKRFYVEADFTAHWSSFESGGYQSYGSRIVYGLNQRLEVGINAFYTRTSPAEPVEIQPNFKIQLYKNEERGLSFATGALVFVPVTQRSSNPTRSMVYAVASKNFKGTFGPRFTLGSYALIGPFEPDTSRTGLLLGYEQPISRKLSFVADWATGRNDYGYVVAGAGINLSRKSILYVGYNIGNQGRGNNSVGIFYGRNF
jgi:hypothetical protein